MPTYDENDKRKWAQEWRRNGRNMSKIARNKAAPSRGTLVNWSDDGEPESLTGGDTWPEWADREDALAAEEARQKELDRAHREDLSWAEAEKERVRELCAEAYRQLTSGGAQITATQYKELVNLFIRLDNLSKEKIEWQQAQFTKMLTVLMEHVSEKQFTQIKAAFMQQEAEAREQMPLPPADEAPDEDPVYRSLPYAPDGQRTEEVEELVSVPAMPAGADTDTHSAEQAE